MNWEPPSQLYYWSVDCLYELMKEENMHYLHLGDGGLKGVLLKTEKDGRSYRKFIKDYPEVRCESLERYYLLRRATGKLDLRMLNDLLFGGSWREANWGAWLAALAPQEEYIESLERQKQTVKHGTKVVNLALASCGGSLPSDLSEHFDLLSRIRDLLCELPQIRTPMRLVLGDEVPKSEIAVVKKAYQLDGLTSARHLARKGVLGYYSMSYKEWLTAGAPLLQEWLEKNPAPLFVPLQKENKQPKAWWKLWKQ